jgi:hypothetical protein
MKWIGRGLIVLLTLAVIAVIAFRISAARAPAPIDAPPLPAPIAAEGANGLDASERGLFYHLSEGGEIFPLDWALALETETGTSEGRPVVRPFLDNIERRVPVGPEGTRKSVWPAGRPLSRAISHIRHSDDRPQLLRLPCWTDHVSGTRAQDRWRAQHGAHQRISQGSRG